MKPGRLLSDLESAADDIQRALTIAADRLTAMVDAEPGWPRAASYDGAGGGGSVLWCELHEREVAGCHRADEPCDGVPVVVGCDPAGEAAIGPNPVAGDRRQVERLVADLRRHAFELVQVFGRYESRPASEAERRATARANERPDECWACALTEVARGVPRFAPGFAARLVEGERRLLCRWHYEWHRATGGLPTRQQVDDHHAGRQVRRPA